MLIERQDADGKSVMDVCSPSLIPSISAAIRRAMDGR